jgi:hypothetical protein
MSPFWLREGKPNGTQSSPVSHAPPMPIVVGSPRSGTTLLRFMLDSHPELAIPPETSFLTLGSKLGGSGDKLREKFFREIVNFPKPVSSWPDFEVPEEIFHAALMKIAPFSITEGYRAFYRLYAARFGKLRWGDKTPLYCLHLNTSDEYYPRHALSTLSGTGATPPSH